MKHETFKTRESKLLNCFPKQMSETVSRLVIEIGTNSDSDYLEKLQLVAQFLSASIMSYGTERYQVGLEIGLRRGYAETTQKKL